MIDLESQLTRWQSAGVLDADTAARIRAYETERPAQQGAPSVSAASASPAGLKWLVSQGSFPAPFCWPAAWCSLSRRTGPTRPRRAFSPGSQHDCCVSHRRRLTRASFEGFSSALHAVGTISTGAAIALVGQIFNIQEHWPAAVLLGRWPHSPAGRSCATKPSNAGASTAAAWIFSELAFRINGHIGDSIYMGRLFFVWAVLYITFFIGSQRKAVQGTLFAVSVIGAVIGIVFLLGSWTSWDYQTYIPFGTRVWAWIAIAVLPVVISAFHGHKGLVPITAAIAFVIALPYCHRAVLLRNGSYAYGDPGLLAHALVAAFAVFLCWWGRAHAFARAGQSRHSGFRGRRRMVLLQRYL